MSRYSGPDDQVETLLYCPAKKRSGHSLDLFDRYWKDVHGPTCARVGHTWQYTQYHVAHDEPGLWNAPQGVSRLTSPEEQIEGIAELSFLSIADRDAWFDAAGVLARDEQNVFDETTPYMVTERRSRTYVDDILDRMPNGDVGVARYHVLLKKREGVELDELWAHLTDTFAPNVIESPLVLKFRLHLFDPYSQPWEAVDVENALTPERQAHAAFEIAFKTRLQLALFQQSAEYEAAVDGQARLVRQVSCFAEREVYPMVQEGRATLLGLRSASVAKTIAEAGAVTNFNEDIIELFTGGAARVDAHALTH